MTLSELSAFETAYHVLQPLDSAGRRRALQWLADALEQAAPLPNSGGLASASAEAPVAEAKPRRRRAVATAATKAPASRSTSRTTSGKRKKSAPAETGSRVYRRMPDANEIMAAYQQVGTVSALADHFDVPLYTVTHWARRLRDQGFQIGRSS